MRFFSFLSFLTLSASLLLSSDTEMTLASFSRLMYTQLGIFFTAYSPVKLFAIFGGVGVCDSKRRDI